MPGKQRFRITDVRVRRPYLIEFGPDALDIVGWAQHAKGWSIGPVGSGARIELDERLQGAQIGIFPAGHHVLLWGKVLGATPAVSWLPAAGVGARLERSLHAVALLSLAPRGWVEVSPEDLRRFAPPGHIRMRFDGAPIRIGNSIITMLW